MAAKVVQWCCVCLLLVAEVVRCEIHRVQWTVEGVAPYQNTPLEVQLSDTLPEPDVLILECVPGNFSNVLEVSTQEEFANCDSSSSGEANSVGECHGLAQEFTYPITENSEGVMDFRVGTTVYFASYSDGRTLRSAIHNRTRGGQCLMGLKLAVKVVDPQATTPPPTTANPTTTATPETSPSSTISSSTSLPSTSQPTTVLANNTEVTLFQLLLSGVRNCEEWQLQGLQNKLTDVTTTVQENTQNLCQCGFSLQHISDGAFECFSNPDEVTFRARLHGTGQASSSQLMSYMKQWIMGDVTLLVQGLNLRVDSTCSIAISSFSDPECESEQQQQPPSGSTFPAVIGGAVAGGVALVVIVVAVGMVVAVIKRHSTSLKRKEQAMKWSEVENIHIKECAAYVKTVPHQGTFDNEMPMTNCPAYETKIPEPIYEYVM